MFCGSSFFGLQSVIVVLNDCLLFTEIGANIHNVIGYIFMKMLDVPERLKYDGNLAQKGNMIRHTTITIYRPTYDQPR